ncbi:methyltransferase-like protein 27 [Tubulanus polymorphus]|uniref:methyltransferase-like protein 27 n=1 Tax=Tubulanus polymorphus TaxID=672921 RepID=UPI003DA631EF
MNDTDIAKRNARRHHPGMSTVQVVNSYNDWNSYDDDMRENNYRGPRIIADTVNKYLTDKRAKILDVAAGTGLVAEHLLNRYGFDNLDALEPSETLVQIANGKKLYTNISTELITDKPTSIPSETYDCVLTAGGMGQGHIPCAGLDELLRLARQGAFICIVMRAAYLTEVQEYNGRLEPKMEQMVAEGRWTLLERTIVNNYSWENDGIVYVYQKM